MNGLRKYLLILIFIMLIILLTLLIMVFVFLKQEENVSSNNSSNVTVDTSIKEKTVKDVIEEHDSEYISQENNKVYATLAKDLYDDEGKSNEDFFVDLVNDLDSFFPNQSFYVIDEEKNITIYAKRNSDNEEINLTINDMEDFYNQTDGRDYSLVENSQIVDSSNLLMSNTYLETLEMNNMYFKYIEKYLTEGKELDNGYTAYVDQKVKIKLSSNKAVFNLVFMEDYEDKILYDISLENKLSEIAELYDDYVFGGLDKGYLGYRAGNFYYFFYENEASIYPYSYTENEKFENLLETYLETKDLETFSKDLTQNLKKYADFEYDADIQKLYITYPTRGIKIDIQDNNPEGITLYSNYYFTDTTKQLVKNGTIQYNKNDYVDEYEQARKEAE